MSSYISLSPNPHHHHYPTQKLQNANHLTPGKVCPTLMLVSYLDKVAEVIAFVFSDTLICNNATSMQAVMFSCKVGMCSVMLEGDVYEPSRMMSSSATPSSSGILMHVQELHMAEECVMQAQKMLPKLLTWTPLFQHREAQGEPKEDAWHCAKGQEKD
jgi:chromosome segregation ATPase